MTGDSDLILHLLDFSVLSHFKHCSHQIQIYTSSHNPCQRSQASKLESSIFSDFCNNSWLQWQGVTLCCKLTGLCLLEPLHKLLHLVHEDSPTLGNVTVLVPLEDNLLGEHLGLVEEHHDLLERLEETLVVVAVLLDLVAQHHLTLGGAGEGREQSNVGLDVLQSLQNIEMKISNIP